MAKKSSETTTKKVAYVSELLGKDKNLTMNAVGKAVTAKFGTQLAHPKLREAFIKAGGKIDTRKGNRTKGAGRKGKGGTTVAKKAPKKAPKKAGKKKAGKKAGGRGVSSGTTEKMDYVRSLAAKVGMTMNSANDAVKKKFGVKLAFNRLKEAFKSGGGQVGKPGRRAGAKAKGKGTRASAGRRASDRVAQSNKKTLSGLPTHMVVVADGRNVETAQFGKKSEAQEYARKRLQSGVSASAIGYYTRGALEVSFGI